MDGYSWNSEDIASEEKFDLDQHYFTEIETNSPEFGGGNGLLAKGTSGNIISFSDFTKFGPLDRRGTWTTATVVTVPEPCSMLMLIGVALPQLRKRRFSRVANWTLKRNLRGPLSGNEQRQFLVPQDWIIAGMEYCPEPNGVDPSIGSILACVVHRRLASCDGQR